MADIDIDSYADLFNTKASDLVRTQEQKGPKLFSPKASQGTDKVYKSVLRWISWYKTPKTPRIQKWVNWLDDPENPGKGFYIDCPSSIKQPSVLQDIFFALKNHEDVRLQNLRTHFSRKSVNYGIVQTMKNPHEPSLVGKLSVFKYPAIIDSLIDSELEPEMGEPMNPFDPMEAKYFSLYITEKAGYNNYEQCRFIGDQTPIEFEYEGKKIIYNGSTEHQKMYVDWLIKNSPDLDQFKYRPWTEDTTRKVAKVIMNIVPDLGLIREVFKKHDMLHFLTDQGSSSAASSSRSEEPKYEPSTTSNFDDLDAQLNTSSSTGISKPSLASNANAWDDL